MLASLDLVEFQDFLCKPDMDQEQVDLTTTKAGFRDGFIWLGLKTKEAVEWLQGQMHLLKPWNEMHTGYKLLRAHGGSCSSVFVETLDRNALKNNRFVKLAQKTTKVFLAV